MGVDPGLELSPHASHPGLLAEQILPILVITGFSKRIFDLTFELSLGRQTSELEPRLYIASWTRFSKTLNCHLEAERYKRGQDGLEMPTLIPINELAWFTSGKVCSPAELNSAVSLAKPLLSNLI